MRNASPLERLMEKVIVTDSGCHLFAGSRDRRMGYGRFKHHGSWVRFPMA
jgi:hypothetical protein